MGAVHLLLRDQGIAVDSFQVAEMPAFLSRRAIRSERRNARPLLSTLNRAVWLQLVLLVAWQSSASATMDVFNVTFWAEHASAVAAGMMNSYSDSDFVSGRCSKGSYVNGGDYHYNLKTLLSRLIVRAYDKIEIWEEASDAYDNFDTVYGIAGCNKLLNAKECTLCLEAIVDHMDKWCGPNPRTAEIILQNCFIRYDNYYIKVPGVHPS